MLTRINIKWLLVNLLALLLLMAVLILWQQQVEQQTPPQEKSYKPDYFMLSAISTQYDQEGPLKSRISGKKFAHIAEFATTDIDAPRFQFYHLTNAPWFGRANNATVIDSGAQLALHGQVYITNGPAPENPLSLATESLRIVPNQNLLIGSEQTTIEGAQSQLQAGGIRLNMDTQVLDLLRQVHGQILPGS